MTTLIALDWGTSMLRACRLGKNGVVLEKRTLPYGVAKLPSPVANREEAFLQAYTQACGDWLRETPACPVLACGMIGSAQGWRQAPYIEAPCDIRQLARQLIRIETGPDRAFSIVPGVWQDGDLPEVMRGEETQIAGALQHDEQLRSAMARQGKALIALPGTHSKWVEVTQNRITHIQTFMTGDLYDALTHHTILAATIQPSEQPDWDAFDQGVAVAQRYRQSAGLLGTLFSVRSRLLCKHINARQQADYLSGLVLGSELLAVLSRLTPEPGQDIPLTFIGSETLCQRYIRALTCLECPYPVHISDGATERGLWFIASLAGLLD
ncbi:2-dehydro-3-deoxygalactonokinase [Brenneria izadpanahii]|uniref:2-dehydro-3-deoxygalactonokinase n=1 Tax=Brenneria izadpanahii TaxID=2722756 RepID=A0ABX7UUK6_9GAMM|nr:2-dehydro-3-deoxygalactonokinase [Brenneria izadpanahii]QTF08980.1 2-dehydro-3-deoxygalactonokinase [Brenneria izadpanahii]